MTTRVAHLPFQFEQLISNDSIQEELVFDIYFNDDGIEIIDINTDTTYLFNSYTTHTISHDLPFNVAGDKTNAIHLLMKVFIGLFFLLQRIRLVN